MVGWIIGWCIRGFLGWFLNLVVDVLGGNYFGGDFFVCFVDYFGIVLLFGGSGLGSWGSIGFGRDFIGWRCRGKGSGYLFYFVWRY